MSTKRVADRFAAAFVTASGRPRDSQARPVPPAALALARRVLDARRRGLEGEACPNAVRARLVGLNAARARRGLVGLLRLMLDSALGAAPATRGGARVRLLRFEAPHRTLDLKIDVLSRGRRRLDLALEGPRPLALRVWTSPPAAWKPLALDVDGGAVANLAASVRLVRVELRLAQGEILRTPLLRLEVERRG